MAAAMADPTVAPEAADDAPDEAAGPGPDDPMEQFQRAALEAIRAGRKILDAAESMVEDPRAVEQLVRTVADLARSAGETVAAVAARTCLGRTDSASGEPRGEAEGGKGEGGDGEGGDARVPAG